MGKRRRDDDDDDKPKKKRKAKGGSSMWLILLLVGGGGFVLLLCLIGGGVGIYFFRGSIPGLAPTGIVGRWQDTMTGEIYEFRSNGTGVYELGDLTKEFNYTYKDNRLKAQFKTGPNVTESWDTRATLDNPRTLRIAGTGRNNFMTFRRLR